ncbi:pyocin knob domain-containing protein [Methylorubrum extorquens]|uniref:pyocin knob domain-containing protein n=1 Tax=Methylorubrum extorquens TaxID=408 RepID=UPI00209F5601|nr:pyocin knob domain-containing protein [Methylorubrum extorquens]MCP1540040.1 hypothetical protein [Methylorubrum extorquens]
MAYRKASEENPVVALGSEDFWAAVQNDGDVRISVGDILVWLRTVLQIEDVNELQAALDAIGATAHQELQDALGAMGGSVSESLAELQDDVNTRATKTELADALGGLDGSVKTQIDALAADVATRATKTEEAAKDTAVRTDFAAADAQVRADMKTATDKLASDLSGARSALQADIDTRATKAQLGTAAARNAGNAAGQLPVLGADGKLDASTIPAVAITDTFPVATQAAMLALDAERGDIAIRSDLNRCFILQREPATTLANWKELLTPTDAVLSVAGLTGAITAAGLKAALGIAIGDVAGLQGALDGLRSDVNAALSTKFDKAGGTVSGDVTATGMVRSDRLTYTRATNLAVGTDLDTVKVAGFYDGNGLVNAPDASWYYIEVQRHQSDNGYVQQRATRLNAGTPEIYVRNQSGAVWGAWYRVWTSLNFNPSAKHNANTTLVQDASVAERQSWRYVLADRNVYQYANAGSIGTYDSLAGSIWEYSTVSGKFFARGQEVFTRGNFDPNTKANVAGQAFTGAVSAIGSFTAQNSGTGLSRLNEGNAERSGYVEFRHADGTRHGYIGWGTAGVVTIAAENGYRYDFNVAPTIGGATIHTSANFNPGTKANVAGQAFTGAISAPGISSSGDIGLASAHGTNRFMIGNADGASYTAHNVKMQLWYGLGLATYDGTVNGFYDSRAGVWDTKGVPRVNGQNVWYPGNFDPNTKASVGATVTFRDLGANRGDGTGVLYFAGRSDRYVYFDGANYIMPGAEIVANGTKVVREGTTPRVNGVLLGNGQGYVYSDLNTHNMRFRVGAGTTADPFKYWGFEADGLFRSHSGGQIYVEGNLRTAGRVVVGEGQTNSYIEMRDTDEGTRYVHNNGGTIGFLNSGAGWSLRSYDDGNIWTPMFGYLSDQFGAKAARINPTVGHTVRIEGNGGVGGAGTWPSLSLWYGGVQHWQMTARNDAYLVLRNGDDGDVRFSFGTDGSLWTKQFGDLNNRIEDRAYAWADARGRDWANDRLTVARNEFANRLVKTGDTMTGDLTIQKAYPTVHMLYPGVRELGWQVRENANAYLWDYTGGNWLMRVDLGGGVVARGNVYAGDGSAILATDGNVHGAMWGGWLSDRLGSITNNANNRVAKTGDQMSGNLVIGKEHPEVQLVWGGIYRWGMLVRNNAELQFRNSDNDSVALAVRPNGSLWSQQMGDIHEHIRAVVNNKSIRLAYAGDLTNEWNINQSFAEPYGGGVLTSRYTTSNQFIVDSWKGGRWRYLQMSDAWGNWYTCGYV